MLRKSITILMITSLFCNCLMAKTKDSMVVRNQMPARSEEPSSSSGVGLAALGHLAAGLLLRGATSFSNGVEKSTHAKQEGLDNGEYEGLRSKENIWGKVAISGVAIGGLVALGAIAGAGAMGTLLSNTTNIGWPKYEIYFRGSDFYDDYIHPYRYYIIGLALAVTAYFAWPWLSAMPSAIYTWAYPSPPLPPYNTDCPICFEVLNEITRVLPCRHAYCLDCIAPWAAISNLCPMCRATPPIA